MNAGQPDPLIGTTIAGRYEVTSKLSQGGMGGIYLATQQPLGRTVVLKVLLQDQQNNQTAILRFEKEARSVSKLVHPHIVSVFDFGQTETGSSYIAMEHLPGRSLRELLQAEGNLAPNRALHIVRGIVSGLGEAHRHGIIHRDLKPENVVLVVTQTDPDFPKILDFGVARTLEENDVNITKQDVIPGTPTYIAPERLQGESGDERSDIYSLGAMWYELVCGRPPFQADTSMRVIMMHLQQTARRPSEIRPDLKLSGDIEHLMLRMLAKNPADRPASATELLDLLTSFGHEPWTVQSAREHAISSLPQPAAATEESPSNEIKFKSAEGPTEADIPSPAPILLDTPKTPPPEPMLLTRKKPSSPLPAPGVGAPIAEVEEHGDDETVAVAASAPAPWSDPATPVPIADARLVLQEVASIEQVATTMIDTLRSDFDRVFILDCRTSPPKCLGATAPRSDAEIARIFGSADEFWRIVQSEEPFYGAGPIGPGWQGLYAAVSGRVPGGVMIAALARDGVPALVVYAEQDRTILDADLERVGALFEAVAGALTHLAF